MKKLGFVIGVIIILTLLGILYSKIFINEPFGVRDVQFYVKQSDGSTKRVYCGGNEDPDALVANHLDNPVQKLLSVKIIFTSEDLKRDKYIYKAYTLFGIPISTVEVDCKTGLIQTVAGL